MNSPTPTASTRRFIAATALALGLLSPIASAQANSQLTPIQAHLDQGDGQAALDALRPILKRSPKNPEALLARSTAYFLVGELELGSKDLDRALAGDPTLRQGWLTLGALRLSEGNNSGALTAFTKARELDPSANENALNIGAAQLLLGNVDQAKGEFSAYLAAVNNTAEANVLIAKNYALANVLAPATDHAAAAIQADERQRLTMRTDPAFSLALDFPPFQTLLASDSFRPPPGSLTETYVLDTPYETQRVAGALIDALSALAIPFDPRVEATPNWALVWSDKLRIKVGPANTSTTRVTLVAPPKSHTRTSWQNLQDRLFGQIAYQLAPKLPPSVRQRGQQ